ncbi:MAG: Chromosome-partitioning protein Spo0J [Syntrophomonadaceae bacterium]|nr:Chromosome-partitioning protein Spo0J [Bacillota bacterium]
MNEVSISLLKPHPKNQSYYDNLPEEKYQEVKRSIEAHGIRDPLKVLPDFTLIAGHQRLRIAQELGLEKVPVTVVDISPEEAEYLLIADNEERRQDDTDPIRKAKRAKFLAEYWGVRRGGDRRPKYQRDILSLCSKNLEDVAGAIGEDVRTTKRLLKLNDLIPPLQALVSSGALGQSAATSLAFLPPSEQEALIQTLGETGVCSLSVAEAGDLRKELDTTRKELSAARARENALTQRTETLTANVSTLKQELQNASAQEYIADMEREIAEITEEKNQLALKIKALQSVPPQIIEKEKIPADYEKIKTELGNLTHAQVLLKYRYKIHDLCGDIVQALGKHVKRLELEVNLYNGDVDISEYISECAEMLEKTAIEMRGWLKIPSGNKGRDNNVIEADFSIRG